MALGLELPSEGTVINQRVGAICGGVGLILALLMFMLVLQIVDDFFFEQKRILLRPDRDATNGPALLDSGQRYAKSQLWALAVIHLRRAAALMPHVIDSHLALAVAYYNLQRYELAAGALEDARHINPDDPQVERLTTVLAYRSTDESTTAPNTTT
jgi:tetratricopeptide (TPR) repeat protein